MHFGWLLAFLVPTFMALLASAANGRVIGRLSLSGGEVYSDNIFFSENQESDFVTLITPTLSLAYKPSGYPEPTFTLGIAAPAEIFARHSDLNNIGDNLGLKADYIYRHSPRLDFILTDRLLRRGESRTGSFGGTDEGVGGSSLGNLRKLMDPGGIIDGGGSCGGTGTLEQGDGAAQENGDLVVRGERVENEVGGNVRFQYSQNATFRGGYCWDSTWFLGEGGTETIHSLNVEGNYQRWRQHNLRAGYTISLIQSRNGKDDIVHDFDVGDDFISQREIRLTPTLTVRADTGLAVLTSGESKFRVKHKLNLEVVKVWRAADLTLGVRRGLTGSIGVSGPSYTTEFFSRFTLLISRRLTAFAETEFALFDAEDADFTTFQAVLGLQYWLTSWLSANLGYNYSWVDSQDGTAARETLGRGKVDSNTVFLFFAAHFDLWPRLGLGRGDLTSFGVPSGTPARRSLRSQPRP